MISLMIDPKFRNSGFTVIEILMVIALIAILSIASVEFFSESANEAKFQETVSRINQLRNAILGNADVKDGSVRTSFGYLGDLGSVPSSGFGLQALVSNPGVSAWQMIPEVRLGMGWNGPYASNGNPSVDLTVDAWGSPLLYDPGSSPPTLTSYGADQAPGGAALNQDITVTLPVEASFATVQGYICLNAGPMETRAEVELNYPDGSGALKQELIPVEPDQKGYFQFSNIPFGVRSITVYLPSKDTATQTIGPVLITIDKANFTVPCGSIDIGSG